MTNKTLTHYATQIFKDGKLHVKLSKNQKLEGTEHELECNDFYHYVFDNRVDYRAAHYYSDCLKYDKKIKNILNKSKRQKKFCPDNKHNIMLIPLGNCLTRHICSKCDYSKIIDSSG